MDMDRAKGVITPPPEMDSEASASDATFAGGSCPISDSSEVNNTGSAPFPPSPASSLKSRRDRNSLQREAHRSGQFITRQRSSTTSSNGSDEDPLLKRRSGRNFRRKVSSLPADGLKAIEPPHERFKTKMAFAEQQQWITVQQKTFTKWYIQGLACCTRLALTLKPG